MPSITTQSPNVNQLSSITQPLLPSVSIPSLPSVTTQSLPSNQSLSNVGQIQIGSTGVFNKGIGLNKGQYNFVVTNVIKPNAEVEVDFGANVPDAYHTKTTIINGQRVPSGGNERFRNLVRKSDGRWLFKGVQRFYVADSIVFN